MDLVTTLRSSFEASGSLDTIVVSMMAALAAVILCGVVARVAERWGF